MSIFSNYFSLFGILNFVKFRRSWQMYKPLGISPLSWDIWQSLHLWECKIKLFKKQNRNGFDFHLFINEYKNKSLAEHIYRYSKGRYDSHYRYVILLSSITALNNQPHNTYDSLKHKFSWNWPWGKCNMCSSRQKPIQGFTINTSSQTFPCKVLLDDRTEHCFKTLLQTCHMTFLMLLHNWT